MVIDKGVDVMLLLKNDKFYVLFKVVLTKWTLTICVRRSWAVGLKNILWQIGGIILPVLSAVLYVDCLVCSALL